MVISINAEKAYNKTYLFYPKQSRNTKKDSLIYVIEVRANGLDKASLKQINRKKNMINDKESSTTLQKSMGKKEERAKQMVL